MSIEFLFNQLKHPNPNLRDRAMSEIAESRDETTIPRLMEIVGEDDTVYRRAAVRTLGFIGVDSVPFLVDSLLNSDSVTIRSSCAKALAQIAANLREVSFPDEAIEGLKKALNDQNPIVHLSAAMALGEVGFPVIDLLIEVLQTTENLTLAVAIINALGSLDDKRVIEVLTALAEDETADVYVQESATSALSRLDLLKGYAQSQPK